MIIGTAGHIDHGKTSLVRALTGVDTDRLKEEKARGITIELGFAYLNSPNGQTLGFVDVPGHERLVHTMLAGATGIDFVLLVVACDDGVMPQTREHVAILDLLGLTRGVVALTKCDLASDERIAEVSGQIRSLLGNTGLHGAGVFPVSATTGQGLEALRDRLDAEAGRADRCNADARFRLAVDRVFSLAGAGTVVTGTVLSGNVRVGDTVAISPSGLEGRVRSIHAQNRDSSQGSAGERCALALVGPGIDTKSVRRGDIVLDPSLAHTVRRLDARFKLLGSERKKLSQWQPVKFHHASAERDARLLVLGDDGIEPGDTDFVQIVLADPLSVVVGDRYVIRDAAASRTMGGGEIVDLSPPERRRSTPARRAELEILASGDVDGTLVGLLEARGYVDLDAFLRDRAAPYSLGPEIVQRLRLVRLDAGTSAFVMNEAGWARFSRGIRDALANYHASQPDLPGLGQERLRLAQTPRLPAAAFSVVLTRLVAAQVIVLDRSWVRLPDHVVTFSPDEERAWIALAPLLGGEERFRPPRVRDIARARALDEKAVRRIFKIAAQRGDLEEIAKDHFFRYETVVEMADIVRDLATSEDHSEFSVIAFRDRLDNGRKVAIQILEFFDRQGLTMRRGDIRRLNPHKRDLYSRRAGPLGPARRDGGETSPVGRPDFKSGEGRETVFGGFDSCLLRQPNSGARK